MRVNSFNKDHVGVAEKILQGYGIENVVVDIFKYPGSLSTPDISVQGFMKQDPFKAHHYIVYLTNDFDISFKKLFIHEAAHIQQYEEGKLSLVNREEYWEGEPIDFTTEYFFRPHEMDARKRERKYRKAMRKGWMKKFFKIKK